MAVDDHAPELDPEANPARDDTPLWPPRFDRLRRSSAASRLSSRRLAVGILVMGAVGCVVWKGGIRAANGLARWVADQPEHQIAFTEITLDPEPPPFIRRGTQAILDSVRREGKYGQTISVLGTDLDRLRLDLRRNVWIENVESIRSSYHRLTVTVRYRQPMALMTYRVAGSKPLRGDLIDRQGVELPTDDAFLNWAEKGTGHFRPWGFDRPLMEIFGFGTGEPDRLGLVWHPSDRQLNDEQVQQAAHLAEYLGKHRGDVTPQRHPLPDLKWIGFDRILRCFLLRDSSGSFVCWGSGPGDEATNEPSAAEKWTLLGRYIDAHGTLSLPPTLYLRLRHPEAQVETFVPRSDTVAEGSKPGRK